MPITSSAKKAHRASLRKRDFNLARKKAVKDAVKELKLLVAAQKKAEATAMLSTVFQALDKAAKGHTIEKGTASRKKARLSALVKKIS